MAAAAEPRRRKSVSDFLEMALLARQSRQPSVKISVENGRVTGAEVYAAHNDIETAEQQARIVAERIMSQYPAEPGTPEQHKVKTTRNAAGVTQIEMESRYSDDTELAAHFDRYDTARANYPLPSGKTTADGPRQG